MLFLNQQLRKWGYIMFCSKCGKEIHDEAVVCPFCGCATQNFNAKKSEDNQQKNQPIIINNSSSASSSASASAAVTGKVRRHYYVAFDIFMILITGGLWIIWMILRPKYY